MPGIFFLLLFFRFQLLKKKKKNRKDRNGASHRPIDVDRSRARMIIHERVYRMEVGSDVCGGMPFGEISRTARQATTSTIINELYDRTASYRHSGRFLMI